MNWLLFFLKLFGFAIVTIIIYNVLNIYVLSKYKPNKWIIFALAIAMLVGPKAIKPGFYNTIPGLLVSIVFIILFLWFIDLFKNDKYEMKNKEKDIKIRPKAKPNRAKHNKDKN
ncbi:hypothetical protein DP129_00210 [Clostridium tetani]|uniref:hypothetical protein n=1 Tax=Clostridium tetani TaxID=1513 RepID=UPI00100BCAB0|nr:hypothetical protein [Clostridium tetani]RXI42069.1 hypothetical protein DP129_00210 [Clostridium tetani]